MKQGFVVFGYNDLGFREGWGQEFVNSWMIFSENSVVLLNSLSLSGIENFL